MIKSSHLQKLDIIVALCDSNKSLNFDGFTFSFIRRFRSFASYFVTLIPKVKFPDQISTFRLISPIDSLFKLGAKVLVSRPGEVMKKLVSSNQYEFRKERSLVDVVVVVIEVIDLT